MKNVAGKDAPQAGAFSVSEEDSAKLPYDIYDLGARPGEEGATFVPLRVVVTRKQLNGGQSLVDSCTCHMTSHYVISDLAAHIYTSLA